MRKLKGFTLVEILIVIVIIGILIGALVPRMQSAQGRARDVARKNDLSQLQAAIVTSYQDKGKRPGVDTGCATDGCDISKIEAEVLAAGMNGVPKDPLTSSAVKGLGTEGGQGQYRYMIVDSYGSENGGFVLMAKTEVEGGSNWVVCDSAASTEKACNALPKPTDGDCPSTCANPTETMCGAETDSSTYEESASASSNGAILAVDADIRDIKPCGSLRKDTTLGDTQCSNNSDGAECVYRNESQLRYILVN